MMKWVVIYWYDNNTNDDNNSNDNYQYIMVVITMCICIDLYVLHHNRYTLEQLYNRHTN